MEYENDNEYLHYNYRPSDEAILQVLMEIENDVLSEYLNNKGRNTCIVKVQYLTNDKVKIQKYKLYCNEVLLGTMIYGYAPINLNIQCNNVIQTVGILNECNDFKGQTYFKASFVSAHFLN